MMYVYMHSMSVDCFGKVVLCVVVFFQDDRKTALIHAASKGHQSVVEVLLAAGADINMKDEVSTL